MIGIAVLAFFLIVLNIILWMVFLKKFKNLFSTDDIISSTRLEVKRMIEDVNRATVKDMDIIESQIKQLKSIIAEADRHVAMARSELERQSKAYNLQTYTSSEMKKRLDVVSQSEFQPRNPASTAVSAYSRISDGLKQDESYSITSEGSLYLNKESSQINEESKEKVISSPSGTQFTVYEEGASVAKIPQLGPKVTFADNPVKPKKDINQQIRELDEQGYSQEEIATQLQLTITEVQFSLDMGL